MKIFCLIQIILLTILLIGVGVGSVAADSRDGISQTDAPVSGLPAQNLVGVIVGINEDAGTLDVEILNGDGEIILYVVRVSEDFDFDSIALGDPIEFSESESGNENVSISGAGAGGGNYCANGDAEHPGAVQIVEEYGVSYQEVMAWFCAANEGNGEQLGSTNSGFGEIKLALETAQIVGGTADDLLAMRSEGLGWGQIWSNLGFSGKPKDEDGSGQQGNQSEPRSDNGQGAGAENSNGNGPPDHANNDKVKDQKKDKDGNGKSNGKGKGK